MEYTTLFLDLDNTLLDFSKSEEWAITKTLEEFGLPSDSETARLYSEINSSYWKRFEKGEIPKNAIFEGRFKTLLSVLKREGNTKLRVRMRYLHILKIKDINFMPPPTALLLPKRTELKNRGLKNTLTMFLFRKI